MTLRIFRMNDNRHIYLPHLNGIVLEIEVHVLNADTQEEANKKLEQFVNAVIAGPVEYGQTKGD